ncbi:MAG: NAD(P)-dependent alcohol dehydrogenase [Chloroflexota bacterium]
MTINAYAALEPAKPLEAFQYDEGALGAFDADIAITHCGVCHSDLHLADGDWGVDGRFPMVPGHEIIGTVTAVGDAADPDLVGKRVGIGWQRGSCLSCEWCVSGNENLCNTSVATCVGNYGGFAERVVLDSRFVHVIPDALSSENAAPLLCAGITVFSPLLRYAESMSHVGVMGIGGLGHLAVQFAAKMGCEVTAFSGSPAKEDEAKELGAHHFVNGRDEDAMKKARNSVDVLIATAPANIDWRPYVRAVRKMGVLCFVGIPSDPISVTMRDIGANKAIAGSVIGGRHEMRQMLDFSAQHDVVAWTEAMPMDDVNTALSRLRENDVRYRFVLEK